MQMPVTRVLSEMRAVGLAATELGPVGYLPSDATELRVVLHEHGLSLTGGFNALTLADPSAGDATLARATDSADLLAMAGASTFVTCAISDPDRWQHHELNTKQWAHLFAMLARLDEICAERGLVQAFHPHVDSLVETAADIERVLDGCDVAWCLDTGHMYIGGCDPLSFAYRHTDRVNLVHLKDLRSSVVSGLNAQELTLMEAVQAGIFVPLGEGDVPIADVITTLEGHGYEGWYVLEQDAAIADDTTSTDGPIRDVRASVAYLRSLDARMGAA
ncbi:MAG: sugar phosphate isomerase/epimerase family protein [Acidimicrobiales bacterium]